ncbi:MAG TPA: hypothetical protein VMF10_08085 [Candidatus Aquilonibacter sp.]|nr:hypothetical protein [Candidatus Aquilonibacter sp.]
MKHEEYEKDIGSECTLEQKVVEDMGSERFSPIGQNIADVLHAEEKNQPEKIEGGSDNLPYFCMASGERDDSVTNERGVFILAITNSAEPQYRHNCRCTVNKRRAEN